MLQQTQVKTMLPYYEKFLKAFPNVQALATAKEDDVLSRWQGLGYYSRARNLMKAARYFSDHYDGQIPASYEALLKAPGIGPYTAGAIASLAFGIKAPIVDGNILRVFSRLTNSSKPIDQPKVRSEIEAQQLASMPEKNCGTYNESLMELGALICTPAAPKCPVCPVRKKCEAFRMGTQLTLPVKSGKIKITKVTAVALIVKKRDAYLLFRRPEGELMGGMWEFPEWKIAADFKSAPFKLDPQLIGLAKISPDAFEWKFKLKRSYTKYQETLHVFECAPSGVLKIEKSRSWVRQYCSPDELSEKPLTSAHARIRKQILSGK